MCGGDGVHQGLIRAGNGLDGAALEGCSGALECAAGVAVRLEAIADLLAELIAVVPDDCLREPTTEINVCVGLCGESALVIQEHCFSLERTYFITGVHTIRVWEGFLWIVIADDDNA